MNTPTDNSPAIVSTAEIAAKLGKRNSHVMRDARAELPETPQIGAYKRTRNTARTYLLTTTQAHALLARYKIEDPGAMIAELTGQAPAQATPPQKTKAPAKAKPDQPRLKAENTFKEVGKRLGTTPEALLRLAYMLELVFQHSENGHWLPTKKGWDTKYVTQKNVTYDRGEDKPEGHATYAVLTRAGALYLEHIAAAEPKLLRQIEARLSSGRKIQNAMSRIWKRQASAQPQGELPFH